MSMYRCEDFVINWARYTSEFRGDLRIFHVSEPVCQSFFVRTKTGIWKCPRDPGQADLQRLSMTCEQWKKPWLFRLYRGLYYWIIWKHPYKPTSIMESRRVFFVAHVDFVGCSMFFCVPEKYSEEWYLGCEPAGMSGRKFFCFQDALAKSEPYLCSATNTCKWLLLTLVKCRNRFTLVDVLSARPM